MVLAPVLTLLSFCNRMCLFSSVVSKYKFFEDTLKVHISHKNVLKFELKLVLIYSILSVLV